LKRTTIGKERRRQWRGCRSSDHRQGKDEKEKTVRPEHPEKEGGVNTRFGTGREKAGSAEKKKKGDCRRQMIRGGKKKQKRE